MASIIQRPNTAILYGQFYNSAHVPPTKRISLCTTDMAAAKIRLEECMNDWRNGSLNPWTDSFTRYPWRSTKDKTVRPLVSSYRVGHIYVLKCQQYIKIGFSTQYKQRLKDHRASVPFKLELLYVVDGTAFQERLIHKRLCAYAVRKEWFEVDYIVAKEHIDYVLNYA